MAAAVSTRGLTKHFGDVHAVDELELEIADGEFFSMLGPSGSGKTTVLRLLAGFERPSALAGSTTVAVVPRPVALSKRSVPPCCSMIPRATAMPSPDPPSLVV